MTNSTIFGAILSADVAQDAMIAHLKLWLPTYLAEIDEQRGFERGYTNTPQSWQIVPTFDNTLDGQLPAILAICPGTADKPEKLGDGTYLVTYTVGVAALVKAPDQLQANALAKRYGAAITACVDQKKSLGRNDVEAVTWEGDSYDDVPTSQDRTLVAATVHFNVQFHGVLSEYAGPFAPEVTSEEQTEPIVDHTKPQPDPTTPWPLRGPIPDEEHVVVTLTRKD